MSQKKVLKIKEARKLRDIGKSLKEIAEELNVAKSSASLWVRDMPQPNKLTKEYKAQKKKERLDKVKRIQTQIKEQRRKKRAEQSSNDRLINGDGRWMIHPPLDYQGKTYNNGLYIYEHRYIMEQKLGRLLTKEEVVHHIDGDKLNNHPGNLELKDRKKHIGLHAKERGQGNITLKCDFCEKEFKRTIRIHKSKIKEGYKHCFCCRSCQVKYQHKYQFKKS